MSLRRVTSRPLGQGIIEPPNPRRGRSRLVLPARAKRAVGFAGVSVFVVRSPRLPVPASGEAFHRRREDAARTRSKARGVEVAHT